eukprot:TRINITY_DN86007_c0_g1_i5.p1 TRINITY_DN86007_c0_g1~~TRINITY_DN86007_c0_g1_i5.p1  ORF type:complete len:129 (-),score=9.61 TRINITY_DN86007_c0_g1_i5:66-452(-)
MRTSSTGLAITSTSMVPLMNGESNSTTATGSLLLQRDSASTTCTTSPVYASSGTRRFATTVYPAPVSLRPFNGYPFTDTTHRGLYGCRAHGTHNVGVMPLKSKLPECTAATTCDSGHDLATWPVFLHL